MVQHPVHLHSRTLTCILNVALVTPGMLWLLGSVDT